MISKTKLGAWLNLAWHFNKHMVLRWPWRAFRRGRDLQRFRSTVGAEGFVPLLPAQRAALPAFMGCVHCGLCALACGELQAPPATAWDEAWTFAGGASRSIDRAQVVAHELSRCAHSAAAAAVCPTRVPIPYMAATIESL